MPKKIRNLDIRHSAAGTAEDTIGCQCQDALLKARALQKAILNSGNFSSIVTDEKGVIQVFNPGAKRMLGHELIARAEALSVDLNTMISPDIEDVCQVSCTSEDGRRFSAIVSVTTLRNPQDTIIGYLLSGMYNTVRKQMDEVMLKAEATKSTIFKQFQFLEDGFNIGDTRINMSERPLGKKVRQVASSAIMTSIDMGSFTVSARLKN